MRKVALIVALLVLALTLGACSAGGGSSKAVTVDYEDAATFEAALNAGEDLTGKVVRFTVDTVVPDSAFGYNLEAGEHLNFCSTKNPGVKAGETVTVRVKEISSMMGSYVISYDKL